MNQSWGINMNVPKVMFVDDDNSMLTLFSRFCSGKPYEVMTYTDPISALERVASADDITVVVSDYMMHKMDGVNFLNRVRDVSPYSIRMLLSAYDIKSITADDGLVHHTLTKPFSRVVLLQTIDDCIALYGKTQK